MIYLVQVKMRRENIHSELSVSKDLILWRSRRCDLEIGLRVKCGGLSGSLGSSHVIETYSWPIYSFLEHEIGNSFMVCLDRGMWQGHFDSIEFMFHARLGPGIVSLFFFKKKKASETSIWLIGVRCICCKKLEVPFISPSSKNLYPFFTSWWLKFWLSEEISMMA